MMRLHVFPEVCVRIEDGTEWVPAVDPNLDTYMAAMDALRLGRPRYYFRGVRRLWWFVWVETGETWQFSDPRLFTIDRQSTWRSKR